MASEEWQGFRSHVCPLRALLNNLTPRINGYCQWLGRSAEVWHGDVSQSQRQRILTDRPDILLTTPESLEAMLVSTKVDPRLLFSGPRPWWSMRSTPSPAMIAGGTCWECWNGCPGWPAAKCSGSDCQRP